MWERPQISYDCTRHWGPQFKSGCSFVSPLNCERSLQAIPFRCLRQLTSCSCLEPTLVPRSKIFGCCERFVVANSHEHGHVLHRSKLLLTSLFQATPSKRCGPASIYTRVFAIKALWHCACLPTGSPLEPSSGAALVEVRRSTVQRAANNGAKKVQHRIESGPSGSPVEPSCGTSLSTPDLNATPSQQKWLSELPDHAPHLEPLSAVSIVTDACGDKRKTELHQAQ